MEKVHILLFYKFEPIVNLKKFSRDQKSKCDELGVLGKILIAKEGINGSISGTQEQTNKYKMFLKSIDGFKDIKFKEELAIHHPFTKMQVLIRDEIVAIKHDIDMSKTGNRINPKELLDLYKCGEDFILLDTRNDYESKVGKFKNAVTCNTKTFREFPKFVYEFIDNKGDEIKKKKIVMYCTGGIRCEKASAFMKENGFEDVSQLDGGIINFCQEYPDTIWEGKCFVFDKRLLTDLNQKGNDIAGCEVCGGKCDLLRNCRNLFCDRKVVMCVGCQEKMVGNCSKECLGEFRKQCMNKSLIKQMQKRMIKES
jgi:UPF0176 protein